MQNFLHWTVLKLRVLPTLWQQQILIYILFLPTQLGNRMVYEIATRIVEERKTSFTYALIYFIDLFFFIDENSLRVQVSITKMPLRQNSFSSESCFVLSTIRLVPIGNK